MKLGDCMTIVRGVSYKPADLHRELHSESVILLRANNIAGGRINHDDVQYVDLAKVKEQQYLRRGDILVCASSGSKKLVGKAALIQEDAHEVFGTFCLVIRPEESVEPGYLGHYFQSLQYRNAIEVVCTGSNIKNLKPAHFNELDVNIPDVATQRDIVKRLDGIQVQIAEYQALLVQLDELVKSRFVEMFGDPDTNPLSINTMSGSKLFKLGNGKARPQAQRFEKGVPAYGGNGISWYTNEVLVDHPTIVIGRVGRHCGNTRLVEEPCWVTDNAMYIRDFKVNCFDMIYLSTLMEVIDFNRFADAGDLWKITQKPFMEYRYPVPPLALQQEFAAFVAQVDKLKLEAREVITKLQILYDSLAQEFFAPEEAAA